MIKDLSVANAAEFFMKGYVTNNTGLKAMAVDFIADNFAEVKKLEAEGASRRA
jgi:hypothetical protein